MTNSEKVVRQFKIADPDMLEDSRTIQTLFSNDLASFVAFDPTLNTAFADQWLADIEIGDAFPTDELYRDQIQVKTEAVTLAKKACRAKYNECKYYVLKAFSKDFATQQEFGLDDYDSARQSDTRLLQFMIRMHSIAVKHQAKLLDASVGYTAPKIAEILTLANSLLAENNAQEVFVKGQQPATQDRVLAMNAVWKSRTQVAAAAKIVFASDFAKYQQYLLPSSDASPDDFAIMGTVLDAESNEPLQGVRVMIESNAISVFTDAKGKYGFADNLEPGNYNLAFELLDYAAQTKSVTVNSADETITINVNLAKA